MKAQNTLVMVGAGIASISAIKAIREHDQSSPIILISNEDRLPYKRTQINKTLTLGFSKEDFAIHTADYYAQNQVEIVHDHVDQIDPQEHTISLHNGKTIVYKKCLLALGHTHRVFTNPNVPPSMVFTIYTAAQSEKLIQHARTHKSYLIVGGGVEGVEMADQLTKMGKQVCLVHRSPHLMHTEFSPAISAKIKDVLVQNGVMCIEGDLDNSNLQVENGEIVLSGLPQPFIADAIISCIGSEPNIQLPLKANVAVQKGILVDQFLHTSQHDIFAAGNVAQLPKHQLCHLWHHAEAQGYCAGLNMIGIETAYAPKPYRLKTELFGQFFYSHNFSQTNPDMEMTAESHHDMYRELYFHHNQLKAALMVNDKARAKTYQEAVWANWDKQTVKNKLSF